MTSEKGQRKAPGNRGFVMWGGYMTSFQCAILQYTESDVRYFLSLSSKKLVLR